MNALEKAQAKRERRANRKNPTNYAKFNVTPEGEAQREKANERIIASRAEREARALQREQEIERLLAEAEEHVHGENCSHDHGDSDLPVQGDDQEDAVPDSPDSPLVG